jgi:hypothetical protein
MTSHNKLGVFVHVGLAWIVWYISISTVICMYIIPVTCVHQVLHLSCQTAADISLLTVSKQSAKYNYNSRNRHDLIIYSKKRKSSNNVVYLVMSVTV